MCDLGTVGRFPQIMASYQKENSVFALIPQVQDEGIPQDSLLSATLFNIKINKELPCAIDVFLYMDDLMICFKLKCIHTIERKLQQRLKKISRWATVNQKQNVSIFV